MSCVDVGPGRPPCNIARVERADSRQSLRSEDSGVNVNDDTVDDPSYRSSTTLGTSFSLDVTRRRTSPVETESGLTRRPTNLIVPAVVDAGSSDMFLLASRRSVRIRSSMRKKTSDAVEPNLQVSADLRHLLTIVGAPVIDVDDDGDKGSFNSTGSEVTSHLQQSGRLSRSAPLLDVLEDTAETKELAETGSSPRLFPVSTSQQQATAVVSLRVSKGLPKNSAEDANSGRRQTASKRRPILPISTNFVRGVSFK